MSGKQVKRMRNEKSEPKKTIAPSPGLTGKKIYNFCIGIWVIYIVILINALGFVLNKWNEFVAYIQTNIFDGAFIVIYAIILVIGLLKGAKSFARIQKAPDETSDLPDYKPVVMYMGMMFISLIGIVGAVLSIAKLVG